MQARDEFGRRKYGGPLRANNGRDPLVDAWQEALDLWQYIAQMRIEGRRMPMAMRVLIRSIGDYVEAMK